MVIKWLTLILASLTVSTAAISSAYTQQPSETQQVLLTHYLLAAAKNCDYDVISR